MSRDDAPLPPPARDWHALSADEAAAHLDTHPVRGLDEADAAERLARHGENRLPLPPGKSALLRFVAQLTQPLVLVLIVAGAVTTALGEYVDAGVILGVVLVNAVIGFVQEGKAEAALAALARAMAAEAVVVRGGRKQRLGAHALVPGDVVLLAAGDRVPADLRLVEARGLQAMEASLTGESAAVRKLPEPLPADTLLADRTNMAYAGTMVVSGQGVGLVAATGGATETGRISRLIAEAPDLQTPLTKKMAAFSNWLLLAIGGLALLTFGVGLLRGERAFDMFMAAVALSVGAIPEGLPAAVTITLAIGVSRMARRRAIIRKLPAVEALGSTTVICSDKTGTLTENQMTVREVWAGGDRHEVSGSGYAPEGKIGDDDYPPAIDGALRELLVAGVLCNDAGLFRKDGRWEIAGDPTEGALLVLAKKGGLDEATLQAVFPRLDVLPFDSVLQYMATAHEVEGVRLAYVKGAIERLLPRCGDMLDAAGDPALLDVAAIERHAQAMAGRGYRVLALARAACGDGALCEDALAAQPLTFLGLVGMIDPPRPRAIGAVKACHGAGIAVKMITGDHALTALAIARQLGIDPGAGGALTGRELAVLDDAALARAAVACNVFARVEPEQKLRLVRALQQRGEVVAMTGDGVNDAPALKSADIGVAMGLSGTDVAREAAAMVLTDDNFASIEAAVEEGRGVYDNLVKFITWTLPTNFGEGLVIVAAILAGATLPITPLQILWINMTTAVLLGLMLAFEPVERGLMQRPPRPPQAPVLDRALIARIVLVSVLMLAGAYGLFLVELAQGATLAEARTVAVNVFVVVETFYLFNCRSLTRSFVAVGLFSNPWVWVGAGIMIGLQLLLTYLPLMNRLFGTAPIGLAEWAVIAAVGWLASLVVGAEKRFRLFAPAGRAGGR
ncbi:cation-translocating P-type ATPase [Azospira restricta]|uniref:HAD-IC family P-type ATPase n=1 Tax=Azospira restricta TaxID=404405 RepID=A0A974SRR8_9RHOO|nr:HAD-IC family P-type ATPase [Azospira restricta]QRJ65229.1 HAD-IC family P-type ATPase [Azospira restricta]